MPSNRRIKVSLTFACLLSLIACGGGGGDGYKVPGECRSYCRTGCAKVGLCIGLNDANVEECTRACVDATAEDQISTAESCTNATAFVLSASCDELRQIYGLRLRSGASMTLDGTECSELGEWLAESAGE